MLMMISTARIPTPGSTNDTKDDRLGLERELTCMTNTMMIAINTVMSEELR
jgi:hypothetical protein